MLPLVAKYLHRLLRGPLSVWRHVRASFDFTEPQVLESGRVWWPLCASV